MFSKKSKRIVFIISIFIIFLFGIASLKLTDDKVNRSNEISEFEEVQNLKNLRNADFWDENDVSFIHIQNDNWSATALPWIQVGDGTETKPHIIENVTINGKNQRDCIIINASNQHFIIRNCTVYNAAPIPFLTSGAGIWVENCANGKLIDNNCSNNDAHGIYLIDCNNMIVKGNKGSDNTYAAIFVATGWYNTKNINISDNNINYNFKGIEIAGLPYQWAEDINIINNSIIGCDPQGIVVFGYCRNINVSKNTIINNKWNGIAITAGNKITVMENKVYSNKYGIHLTGVENSTVINNIEVEKNNIGILLTASHYNNVTGNIANYNNESGIISELSFNNTLLQNTANYNKENGIFLNNSIYHTIYDNIANYNDKCGIFLNWSFYNNISENTAKYNYCGINLTLSYFNDIIGNTLTCNKICYIEIDCFGMNFFDNNVCGPCPGAIISGDDDDNGKGKEEAIPSYDTFILIGSLFIISIIITKKRWKSIKRAINKIEK